MPALLCLYLLVSPLTASELGSAVGRRRFGMTGGPLSHGRDERPGGALGGRSATGGPLGRDDGPGGALGGRAAPTGMRHARSDGARPHAVAARSLASTRPASKPQNETQSPAPSEGPSTTNAPRAANETVPLELRGVAAAGQQLMQLANAARDFAKDSPPKAYERLVRALERDDLLSSELRTRLQSVAEHLFVKRLSHAALTESEPFGELLATAESLLHFVESPSAGSYRDIRAKMRRSIRSDRGWKLRDEVTPFLEARPDLRDLEPFDPEAVFYYESEGECVLGGKLHFAKLNGVSLSSFQDLNPQGEETRSLRSSLQELRLAELNFWDFGPISTKLRAHQNYTTLGYMTLLSPTSLGMHVAATAPTVVRRLLAGELNQPEAIEDWAGLVSYTKNRPQLQDGVSFTLTNLGSSPSNYRASIDLASRSRRPLVDFAAGEIARDGKGRPALAFLATKNLTAAFLDGTLGYSEWVSTVRMLPRLRTSVGAGAILAHFAESRDALPGCHAWVESASEALRLIENENTAPDSAAYQTFPPIFALERSSPIPHTLSDLYPFLQTGSSEAREGAARTFALPDRRRSLSRSCTMWFYCGAPEPRASPETEFAGAARDLLELQEHFAEAPAVPRTLRPQTLEPRIETSKRRVSLEAVVASVRNEARGIPRHARKAWFERVLRELADGTRHA